ncbi:MAG: 16S rRNA (cytosine(1402)-N(4))-methyltransferase RsmH [Candidatus Nanopelagicales bacterium]|nr:16S rRNA (cytosine(1402)-N(4))-methyltransferase RsmH [Candidatus Nanopelagicales bacterium]
MRSAARSPRPHEPVMPERIVELLTPALGAGDVFVDATLGLGGHSAEILRERPSTWVIGIDLDSQALAAAGEFIGTASHLDLVHSRFDALREILSDLDAGAPSAVLFDLGVSSLQLDSDERGFAYSRDTSLDMRMDSEGSMSAADVVNSYSTGELARVFFQYGEERHARRIATAIARRRDEHPIQTSGELTDVIWQALPAAARRRGGHPAKRVFQALRIEVNEELIALRAGLAAALAVVRVGGRVAVLSYHSLEDRIVKRAFAAGIKPAVLPGLPVIPQESQPWLEALTRGAERPSQTEVARNPRAASARLRAVVKIRETIGVEVGA